MTPTERPTQATLAALLMVAAAAAASGPPARPGAAVTATAPAAGAGTAARVPAREVPAADPVLLEAERRLAAGERAEAVAALIAAGRRRLAAGDGEGAVRALARAADLDPESAVAAALHGRALAAVRDHRAAESELSRAAALGARDAATRFYLGAAQWENGRLAAAEATFRRALEEGAPTDLFAAQLGRLLLWQGRFDEAAGWLERAAAADPASVQLAIDLGRALDGAGEAERALAVLRRAVALAPEHFEARYGLARALARAGEREAAGAELEIYARLVAADRERTRREGVERAARDRSPGADRDAGAGAVADAAASRPGPGLPSSPLAGASSAGDAAAPCGPIRLRDAAAAAGLDFLHDRGARGEKHLPETMGAGLAWLDWDGDGRLDLYAVQSGPYPPAGGAAAANRLYRNLGGGRFEAVLEAAGAADRGYGQGVVAADVDGDGAVDLYLANYGADALYRNRGDGTFEARTEAAGLSDPGWSSSAALADGDGDGDLDLYVTRYMAYDPGHGLFCGDRATGERDYCDPSLFGGVDDLYYVNRGDGAFSEAAAAAGLGGAGGRGLGVAFVDLDGDRRPDLYVANDLDPNHLFRNTGGGRFEELSLLSGAAVNRDGRPEAGMGVAVGDFDADLDPDLAVTNFDVETNTLYANAGGMAFEDVAAASGFGVPSFNRLAFGVAAADFDRDGDLDLYVANGHIFERPRRENVAWAQPDQLFVGDGGGGFAEAPCPALAGRPTVARALALADFDDDGDPDLAVSENGGPLRLLENRAPAAGWLGVRLAGGAPNTEGVGARIVLAAGGRRQARWIVAGDSYQASSDRRALFGLGEAAAESLEVTWPDGRRVRLAAPPAGRYLVVALTSRRSSSAR